MYQSAFCASSYVIYLCLMFFSYVFLGLFSACCSLWRDTNCSHWASNTGDNMLAFQIPMSTQVTRLFFHTAHCHSVAAVAPTLCSEFSIGYMCWLLTCQRNQCLCLLHNKELGKSAMKLSPTLHWLEEAHNQQTTTTSNHIIGVEHAGGGGGCKEEHIIVKDVPAAFNCHLKNTK